MLVSRRIFLERRCTLNAGHASEALGLSRWQSGAGYKYLWRWAADGEHASTGAGEINFVLVGVVFQLGSLVTESIRLTLVQIILQRRNLKLNPITTLSYVAPCCCAFLLVPFILLELPRLTKDTELRFDPGVMLSSAVVAFGDAPPPFPPV